MKYKPFQYQKSRKNKYLELTTQKFENNKIPINEYVGCMAYHF